MTEYDKQSLKWLAKVGLVLGGAFGCLMFVGYKHQNEELSSPEIAVKAVLDAGYQSPTHIGVADSKACDVGSRDGRYYRDRFSAVAANGRKIELLVCRAERANSSSVRIVNPAL